MENEARKTIVENLTPEFVQKVIELQKRVYVDKTRPNEFGNFMYRSLDDIFQKTKPAAAELGLLLFVTDEVAVRGNRFYVEATAILTDGKSTIRTTAFAREAEHKTKSDDAQVTGMASSYARKYCLDGLLQTGGSARDFDGMDNGEEGNPGENADGKLTPEEPGEAPKTKNQIIKEVVRAAAEKGYTADDVKVLIEIHFNKYSSKDVTQEEAYLLEKNYMDWLKQDIPAKDKKTA